MSATIVVEQILAKRECCVCGITFAIPQQLLETLRSDGGSFYCPHGHCLTFGDSEKKRMARELAQALHGREQAQAAARDAETKARIAEAETAAVRKQQIQLQKRVKNGCCPCCNRNFQNLQRHIATKHPEFAG